MFDLKQQTVNRVVAALLVGLLLSMWVMVPKVSAQAPGSPNYLAFSVQPATATAGTVMFPAPRVVLRGPSGLLPSSGVSVTVELINASAGVVLGGTLTATTVNGVATFSDLTVNVAATGLVLLARSEGFSQVLSNSFSSQELILDGGFEQQAESQGVRYVSQSDGSRWGAGWNNWGWSSWNYMTPAGAWGGGGVAFTEDFTTGWKWARSGNAFGIVGVRSTLSQTFTATQDFIGTLSWFDANRSSWREHTWYGRPNDYSVTVTDTNGNVQVIGNYTSQVYLGLAENSWINAGDDRFSLAGKQGWFARASADFNLAAGMTYTLSFNSLSPYWYNSEGAITGADDRVTLLDDVVLTTRAVPTATPTPTPTLTPTSTPTAIPTATPTATATATPTPTLAPNSDSSPNAVPTATPTPTSTPPLTGVAKWSKQVKTTATELMEASQGVASTWDTVLRRIAQSNSCRSQMQVGQLQRQSRRWQQMIQSQVRKELLPLANRRRTPSVVRKLSRLSAANRRLIAAYANEGRKLARAVDSCSTS